MIQFLSKPNLAFFRFIVSYEVVVSFSQVVVD